MQVQMLLQGFSYFEGEGGIVGLKVLFLFYKYGENALGLNNVWC